MTIHLQNTALNSLKLGDRLLCIGVFGIEKRLWDHGEFLSQDDSSSCRVMSTSHVKPGAVS